IEAVNEVRDYSKIISGLKKKQRRAKKEKEETETQREAEELYEKFKKGEKLGTDDIMTLQKAGLL
ncbi:MAG: phosphoserine phosphatase, partial [Candidatus Thermoplasmatota archaeon]